MKTIYYSMHELFLQELKSEEILNKNYLNVKKNLKINYEYFLESLFLSSSFIKTNQELNSVEKIVYLICQKTARFIFTHQVYNFNAMNTSQDIMSMKTERENIVAIYF